MDHRIALARPLGRALTVTVAGTLSALLIAVPAMAQQQPQQKAPAAPAQQQVPAQKQAPAAQPAPQAQPAPGGQPGQQTAGEQPPPQLMYSPWTKVCSKGP